MDKRVKSNTKLLTIGSLSQWVLASFLIVTLPLVLVIMNTVIEVGDYNQESQRTLFQTVNANENSRIILQRLVSMERSIRQFLVLNEVEIFQSYLTHRSKFIEEIVLLEEKTLTKKLSSMLTELSLTEEEFFQINIINLADKIGDIGKNELLVFDELTRQARVLLAEGEEQLSLETDRLFKRSQKVRQRLVYSALACIPLALSLGFIFVNLLTRPIKDIGNAIRTLGEEGYEQHQSIVISGPKDLTELGAHLEWLRKKLYDYEFEKQQFIKNISHELKTPLATLKEGTDLLDDNVVGELNAEQKDIVQLMKIGNISINDLVDNLLEYQKTISTNADVKFTCLELSSVIKRVVKDYRLVLNSRKIKLKMDLNEIYITADPDKIRIIFSNLFSNAIKFSPEEGIIGLSLLVDKDEIELLVEDQGVGVAKEVKGLIFDEFYQGNAPQSWTVKGSGLGLALVKFYLKSHNGSIELLPPNQSFTGARFSIRLPKNI